MNVELSLLRLLMYSELYKKYRVLVDDKHIKEVFRELAFLYPVVDNLMGKVQRDLSVDEVESTFWAAFPEAKKDLYEGLFKQLRDLQLGEDVGESLLAQMEQRKAALKLSETAFKYTQGLATLDDVASLASKLALPQQTQVEVPAVSTDLESLLNNVVRTQGLRWRLDFLNKSLGSLRKGDFGFVFARPETGKTTFLASEVSAMLESATSPVIWFNNEEQGEKVMIRFYQAYFGVTLEQLLGNTKQYKRLFNEQVEGKFLLVDDATMSRSGIESIISKVGPSLVLVDQISKVKGFKADRDDLLYGQICQWGRELSKQYCPFMGVLQAGGEGEGQKWLTMDHVAKVKTDAQAEADFILGIGKTHSPAEEALRFINISKNKLLGDEDTIASLRHARSEVLIQPEIGRYKDITTYT